MIGRVCFVGCTKGMLELFEISLFLLVLCRGMLMR